MPESARRRPYRVVFHPPSAPGPPAGPVRRGVIVAADLDAARREALTIARDGGTADIVYVDPAGGRHVLATYTPDDTEPPAPN